MYPDLPKLELFARNTRPGWASWGNEVPREYNPKVSETALRTVSGCCLKGNKTMPRKKPPFDHIEEAVMEIDDGKSREFWFWLKADGKRILTDFCPCGCGERIQGPYESMQECYDASNVLIEEATGRKVIDVYRPWNENSLFDICEYVNN